MTGTKPQAALATHQQQVVVWKLFWLRHDPDITLNGSIHLAHDLEHTYNYCISQK